MPGFGDLEFREVEVASVMAAQVSGECGPDPADIARAMGAAFERLTAYLHRQQLTPAGPPRAIYTAHDPTGVKFTVAVPIVAPAATPTADGSGVVGPLPQAKAFRFTHSGAYAGLMDTYGRITAFMKARGLMASEADWARYMPMWEEYLNDPHTTPQADLLTYIYLPAA